MRVLCVTWIDSMLTEGWRTVTPGTAGEGFKPVRCVSYGWELENLDSFVILACTRANADQPNEQFSGIIGIPRASIESIAIIPA